MLFQEFEFEIIVQPDESIVVPDHLPTIEIREYAVKIDDELLDAHLFRVEGILMELKNISQFSDQGQAPKEMSKMKN